MSDKTCPDCGVSPGTLHLENCDVALCSIDGQQRLMCEHEEGNGGTWTGEWPGVVECREFNLFSRFVPGLGFVPVDRGDPAAVEDLNTLTARGLSGELLWNGERWVLPEGAGSGS
jgi:hypothetical protein